MGIKKLRPEELEVRDLHQILLGSVAPRPIAFVGTLDEDGGNNLAPFSFFNVFSANPPLVIFSPARRGRDNTTKDTYENLLKLGECTVNIVSYPMVNQMVLASTEYEKGVDEFVKSGFTPESCELIKPKRVAESPVSYECRIKDMLNYGKLPGGGNMFVAEIIMIHLNESILSQDGKIDPRKIDNVGRLGKAWYTRSKTDLFELGAPKGNNNIGFDGMPEIVKSSRILSGNDLGRLGAIQQLPEQSEIEQFLSKETEITDMKQRLRQDPEGLVAALHLKAKQLIAQNRIEEAWLTLLS